MSGHGYHTRSIKKGQLGESSKIREELEELEDAEAQGNKILALCELADLLGAVKLYAEQRGLTLQDVTAMTEATERAFKTGER